jgi:DNA polymerase-1
MEASDGTPCNAAYGFANTLIRYATEQDPSHAAVCFDAAMTSFRNAVEPEYKAQRGEPPDDLEPQFDLCHEISVALGFSTWEVDDYEADDLIGTICDEVMRRRGSVRVLTTDKDLCQLVREDGRIVVHDLAKEKTFDADGVRAKFGVSPSQIPDYLGLVGDTIDNLPGVPGVGAKSAAAVLTAFESIEVVPEDVESWGPVAVRGAKRLAEKISTHRDRALKTKELATVVRAVPGVKPRLGELAYRGADRERVEELFERLGWSRIRDRIPKWRD